MSKRTWAIIFLVLINLAILGNAAYLWIKYALSLINNSFKQ